MCGSGSNRHEFKAEEGSLLFESLVKKARTVRTMLTHGLEPSAPVARGLDCLNEALEDKRERRISQPSFSLENTVPHAQ